MKNGWLDRRLKRLNEPKILAVTVVVMVVLLGLAISYALYTVANSLQHPFPDFQNDTFSVTGNNTYWKVTFVSSENSSSYASTSERSLDKIYISIFLPEGSLGLGTKEVGEMMPGQVYSGVMFFDTGIIGQLDGGDYFALERSMYPTGSTVTVEGHSSGWSWSMTFGLSSWP